LFQSAILVNEPDAPNIVFSDPNQAPALPATTPISTTTPYVASGFTSSANAFASISQPGNTMSTTGQLPYSSNSGVTSSRSTEGGVVGTTSHANSASSTPAISDSVPHGIQQQSSAATTTRGVGTTGVSSNAGSPPSQSSQVGVGTTKENSNPTSNIVVTSALSATNGITTTKTASSCTATPTTTNLCSTYNHQSLNVNNDGFCYEVECGTGFVGIPLTANSTLDTSLKNCIGECTDYNVALPFGCIGVEYLGAANQNGHNCLLYASISSTNANSGVDSGRLIYAGYPAISDSNFGAPSSSAQSTALRSTTLKQIASSSAIQSSAAVSSSLATTVSKLIGPPSSSAQATTVAEGTTKSPVLSGNVQTTVIPPSETTTNTPTSVVPSTSTIPYVPLTCSTAPIDPSMICPGNSPTCYQYSYSNIPANFEIECATGFTGATSGQAYLLNNLNDCIVNGCLYYNSFSKTPCIGVTFISGAVTQGGANNCFLYTSITCATRGNATMNSARLLYSGYQQMVDYSDSSYICGGSASSSSPAAIVRGASAAPTVVAQSSAAAITTQAVVTTTTTKAAQAAVTLATSTAGLAQASSSNFPQAWPQDPVCDNNVQSKYFGKIFPEKRDCAQVLMNQGAS
jgi:hypothetical protein